MLGAGCRAFPKDVASEVAALESATWLSRFDPAQRAKKRSDFIDLEDDGMAVVFGLLEETDAEALSESKQLLNLDAQKM